MPPNKLSRFVDPVLIYSLLNVELLLPTSEMLLGTIPNCSSNKEALLQIDEASPNSISADLATSNGPLMTISFIELYPAFLTGLLLNHLFR